MTMTLESRQYSPSSKREKSTSRSMPNPEDPGLIFTSPDDNAMATCFQSDNVVISPRWHNDATQLSVTGTDFKHDSMLHLAQEGSKGRDELQGTWVAQRFSKEHPWNTPRTSLPMECATPELNNMSITTGAYGRSEGVTSMTQQALEVRRVHILLMISKR